MDPLKATISKITYINKTTFTIGDTIIHWSLTIPIHKNLNQLTNISDEKRNIFIKKYDQLKVLMLDEISFINHRMFTFVDKKLRVTKNVDNKFFCNFDVIITRYFCKFLLFMLHGYLNRRTMVLTLWAWTFGKIK
jgi:hypothetical protein